MIKYLIFFLSFSVHAFGVELPDLYQNGELNNGALHSYKAQIYTRKDGEIPLSPAYFIAQDYLVCLTPVYKDINGNFVEEGNMQCHYINSPNDNP